MNNFEINTNFNNNFNNSIGEFNKIFSNSLNQTSKTLNSAMNFEDIFNAVGENFKDKTLKAGTEITIGENKKKSISPSAKFVQDMSRGFSEGITELNDIQKKTEDDIETFASGGDISIHEVMISAQKSKLSMQMAIQLRNQMLNVYNEFKGMSI